MSRVRLGDVADFSRHLAAMQAAGFPLMEALDIIAKQTENQIFRAILERVAGDVRGGTGFPEALARHPFVFPPLYTNMVKSGMAGKNLDTILERLSAHFDMQVLFRKKIRHEFINPLLLALVSGVAGMGLLLATIRTHLGVLTAPGREVPWTVGALLASYNFLAGLAHVAVYAGITVAVVILLVSAIPALARVVYEAMTMLPYIGGVWKNFMVARFARIIATLQMSGVPILDSMEIAAGILGNRRVSSALMRARGEMKEGEGIAGPLKNTGFFPHMVIQMVSAGEETGKLDDMLLKIADYYDAEVEAALLPARLPGILVVLGLSLLVHGLVLFFIVSPLLSALYPG